jgi:hypothetical protein
MRLVLAIVLAELAVLPLSVSAQEAEEGEISEPSLQEASPEEPALRLQLDAAGADLAPSAPRTFDGHAIEEMELRVKRAKMGVAVSSGALSVGSVITAVEFAGHNPVSFGRRESGLSWVLPRPRVALVAGRERHGTPRAGADYDWYWCSEAFDCPEPPAAEAAPEPSLQLELDSAGLEATPTVPQTEEQERKRRRINIGVGVSVAVAVIAAVAVPLGIAVGLDRSFD